MRRTKKKLTPEEQKARRRKKIVAGLGVGIGLGASLAPYSVELTSKTSRVAPRTPGQTAGGERKTEEEESDELSVLPKEDESEEERF